MKFDIDSSNPIVKEVMQTNLSVLPTSLYKQKHIYEFSTYSYHLGYNPKSLTVFFAFSCIDFMKIYNYSGKEWLESEYKGNLIFYLDDCITYELDSPVEIDDNTKQIYNIQIFINISKFAIMSKENLKSISNETKESSEFKDLKITYEKFCDYWSLKLAKFRVELYESIIKKYVDNIQKGVLLPPIDIKINDFNNMIFHPEKENLQIMLGFKIDNKTDRNLSRLFFRELDDAKFGSSGTVNVKFYDNAPEHLEKSIIEKNYYSAGFIVFSKIFCNLALYPGTFTKMLPNLYLIVNFKFFSQLHIQTVKNFLHIRMNTKGKELNLKLKKSKIISDDIIDNISNSIFFDEKQRKEEDNKVFIQDFQKVKI